MRLGPLEIGIVIVIVLIIFGVTRMRQIGRNTAQNDKTPARVRKRKNTGVAKGVRHSRIQILGFILILVGILIILSNLSLIKWIFWGPILAYVIVAIGAVVLFVARRR